MEERMEEVGGFSESQMDYQLIRVNRRDLGVVEEVRGER